MARRDHVLARVSGILVILLHISLEFGFSSVGIGVGESGYRK